MAVLQRTNILSNERLDKPDFDNIEAFVVEDFNAMFRGMFSGVSRVVQGFRTFQDSDTLNDNPTASPIFIKIEDAAVIHTEATGTPFFFVGATGTAAIQVDLVSSATNFVEMEFAQTTGSPDTRAFWDPSANAGAGAEFTQIVDTAENLVVQFTVNNIGFTGGSKIPIAEIVLTGTTITSNIDRRNLFFRLGVGQPADPTKDFPWSGSQTEPNPDRIVDSNAYIGADKTISTFKEWMDAVMTEIKDMKGGAFWYSNGSSLVPGVNVSDLFFDTQGSTLTGQGQWTHDSGTPGDLAWTADVFVSAVIGNLKLSMAASNVSLADGQVAYWNLIRNVEIVGPTFTFTNGSTNVSSTAGAFTTFVVGDFIKAETQGLATWASIASFEGADASTATFCTLDVNYPGATTSESAVRTQALYTMQVDDALDVPESSDTYWFAKRDDNGSGIARIYIRDTGEMEEGEELQIGDGVGADILTFMGSVSETDSTPPYASTTETSGSLASQQDYNASVGESLTSRAAKMSAMLADTQQNFNIELDPGAVIWNGTNITVTGAQLSIPGTTVGAAPVAINTFGASALAANSALYVDIDRDGSGALTLVSATIASLTPSQQRLIMFRNIGGNILVR